MKQLLEDYKRRLKTVTDMQSTFKSNGSISDERKSERLTTKASEYRTFIAELEKLIGEEENEKLDAEISKYIGRMQDQAMGGFIREVIFGQSVQRKALILKHFPEMVKLMNKTIEK